MKKLILLLPLLLAIIPMAYSFNISTTTAIWYYQENANEKNFTGDTDLTYSFGNFSDGDWSTYALTNGTFFMNYSKHPDFLSTSVWQIKYNATSGVTSTNHSIPAACWDANDTKIYFKVNTSNVSDTNVHYCYNDTTPGKENWSVISSNSGVAVYEEAMYWRARGRTYNISYSLISPAAYYVSTSESINFSFQINETNADENHTSFNFSIYTRLNDTAAYTFNKSITAINGSVSNEVLMNISHGHRLWWFWNIADNQSREILNTTVRILDVDVSYDILSIGSNINISMDTGDIFTKGGISTTAYVNTTRAIVRNLTLTNTTVKGACDSENNGVIIYVNNASEHLAYMCNSTEWNSLW